jgi:hypothetical protein
MLSNFVATFACCRKRAGISAFTEVKVVGAGRINSDDLSEASFFDQMAKNAFSTG